MGKSGRKWRVISFSLAAVGSLLLGGCAQGADVSRPAGESSAREESSTVYYKLRVDTEKQSVDIIREEEGGSQRLVYLQMINARNQKYEGYSLCYEAGGQTVKRELGNISSQQTSLYDTLWLPVDMEAVEASIENEAGDVAWSGTLTVKKAERECVIPRSTIYTASDLTTLCIRGSNYYPRNASWRPIAEQEPYWEEEFDDFVSRLHVNTVRVFADFESFGSRKAGNVSTAEYLERVNTLLDIADRHKVKVIFCLYPDRPKEDAGMNLRYFRAAMEPFINDGRILMWDMTNEIDAWIDEQPHYADFVRTYYPMLKVFDPNHMTDIGMANLIKPVAELVEDFDVWQFHYYSTPSAEFFMRIESTYFPGKPYLLGEFGYTSMPNTTNPLQVNSSDEYQLRIYEEMLAFLPKLVELGHNLVGACHWTVYDFPSHYSDTVNGEGYYGIIRDDGSLKPAGEVLAAHFTEWAEKYPAPWD